MAAALRKAQAEGRLEYSLPQGYSLQYSKLQGELYVGGVYVRLFLKNPRFPLRDPR